MLSLFTLVFHTLISFYDGENETHNKFYRSTTSRVNYGLSETHFDVFNFVELDKIATTARFFIPFTFGLTG